MESNFCSLKEVYTTVDLVVCSVQTKKQSTEACAKYVLLCDGNYIHIGTIIRTYCDLPILFQNLSLYNINNQLVQVNVR